MKQPEWVPRFLQAMREGTVWLREREVVVGPCVAAELAGVHKTTPYSYLADHDSFRLEWEEAAAEGRARREKRFQRRLRLLAGGTDTSAQLSQPPAP